MFCRCSSLEELNISKLNTSNVTDMRNMFTLCSKLKRLDLRNFDTSNVTNMLCMFSECADLASIDLSSFNTENVTRMDNMFYECPSLTSLDLSSFSTASLTKTDLMFYLCNHLKTVFVGSEWSNASIRYSTDMFWGCFDLVGGQGTAYSNYHGKTADYAHIDGGPSDPGYFTEKPAFIHGDVNGDSSVTISDVTALIDILLSGETAPQVADCNGDISVNISDVTALIDYLLSGSWE